MESPEMSPASLERQTVQDHPEVINALLKNRALIQTEEGKRLLLDELQASGIDVNELKQLVQSAEEQLRHKETFLQKMSRISGLDSVRSFINKHPFLTLGTLLAILAAILGWNFGWSFSGLGGWKQKMLGWLGMGESTATATGAEAAATGTEAATVTEGSAALSAEEIAKATAAYEASPGALEVTADTALQTAIEAATVPMKEMTIVDHSIVVSENLAQELAKLSGGAVEYTYDVEALKPLLQKLSETNPEMAVRILSHDSARASTESVLQHFLEDLIGRDQVFMHGGVTDVMK